MTTEVYYLTETGNCLATARRVADALDGSAVAIRDVIAADEIRPEADAAGVVFPAYLATLHGVPLIVERFLGKLKGMESRWWRTGSLHHRMRASGPPVLHSILGRLQCRNGARAALIASSHEA